MLASSDINDFYKLQPHTSSPKACLNELCNHSQETKVNVLLPRCVLLAAIEQAEMYHWNDLNGLIVEAITDYLQHRDALPVKKS